MRSNSRIAGCSAAPETAGMSGSASASAAIACCSCSGFRKDQRNETASASTCSRVDELPCARDDFGGIERPHDVAVTVHPFVDADDAPRRHDLGRAGQPAVFVVDAATTRERDQLVEPSRRDQPDPPTDPGGEDVRDRRRTQPEPLDRRQHRRGVAAGRAAPRSRPRPGHRVPTSPGVVGDFARQIPTPSVSTASVKVPPTSTPIQTSLARSMRRSRSSLVTPRNARRPSRCRGRSG